MSSERKRPLNYWMFFDNSEVQLQWLFKNQFDWNLSKKANWFSMIRLQWLFKNQFDWNAMWTRYFDGSSVAMTFQKSVWLNQNRLLFQSLLKWAHILSFDMPKGLFPRLSPGKQQEPGLPYPGVHLPDRCSFQPELMIYSELSKNSYLTIPSNRFQPRDFKDTTCSTKGVRRTPVMSFRRPFLKPSLLSKFLTNQFSPFW